MNRAIKEAKKVKHDVPIGCIIVKDGQIIGAGYNRREELSDVTSHAEIEAIRDAQTKLGTWRLDNCEMYVTLEPCPMCAWAILQSRISTLYFGSFNTQCGAFGSIINLKNVAKSDIKVYGGIKEDECDKILNNFFSHIRTDNDNKI